MANALEQYGMRSLFACLGCIQNKNVFLRKYFIFGTFRHGGMPKQLGFFSNYELQFDCAVEDLIA